MNIQATADFSKITGKINPWLHCAGFNPYFHNRNLRNNDDMIKDLNLRALRTHDWALVNPGQRIIDTHFIFPLMKLDPKDPASYYFDATDSILKLTRDMGVEVFYRMGTSIEHTGSAGHFNITIPEDYDKYAEVMAGIVRHYNRGWANGYNWDIKYWEIWNEPDGIKNCWAGNGEPPDVLRKKFVKLFVTILKRLKSEFPEIQVGGPALCWEDPVYFTEILTACKEAGIAPDFVSWHHYARNPNPEALLNSPYKMRALCDSLGFKETKLIINEWHYIITWDGLHGDPNFHSPDMAKRAQEGPTGHNGIDAATFNLYVMSKWQKDAILDQAYYYGSGQMGFWGFLDGYGQPTKTYFSLLMMGEIVANCESMVESESSSQRISTLAAWSKDKKHAYFLVNEYRGVEQLINIEIKGLKEIRDIEAFVLDNSRNLLPIDVEMHDNKVTLFKDGPHSAAFLLKIEV